MRTLTRKSPARRNHPVLAYSAEHTKWTITDQWVDPEDPDCVKTHLKCMASSDVDEGACTEGDLDMTMTQACFD